MEREESQRQWTPMLQSVFRIYPLFTPVLFSRFMLLLSPLPQPLLISPVVVVLLILCSHQTTHFLPPSSMHLTIRLSHWSECSASQSLSICPNLHSNTSSWMFSTYSKWTVSQKELWTFSKYLYEIVRKTSRNREKSHTEVPSEACCFVA